MNKKLITFVFVLIGAFGVFLLGSGITGFATQTNELAEICSFDFPCTAPQVCCPFFNEEDNGVCHEPEMCDLIWELTRNEMISDKDLRLLFYADDQEESDKNDFVSLIIIGSLIVVLAIIALLINSKSHHHSSKKKKHIS